MLFLAKYIGRSAARKVVVSENAPRTLESAEEPPVVQGNVVETVAAEKK